MTGIPTPGDVSAVLAAIDVSSRPQFVVTRSDLETAAEMIRRLDAALRRPLERITYPSGEFQPRMFLDVEEETTSADLRIIAKSHGYDLFLRVIHDWEGMGIFNETFGVRLARFAPKERLVDGNELFGAWEGGNGELVLAYLKPHAGGAS